MYGKTGNVFNGNNAYGRGQREKKEKIGIRETRACFLFNTIILSLSRTNLRGEIQAFVGLDNFNELFTSPDFYRSMVVTFQFVLLVSIPSVVIGLILALLANNKLKGNRVYELMFSVPMAIASAPAAAIWTMIFHPTNGVLNFILGKEIGWLTDPNYALFSISIVTIWLNLGINFIFLTNTPTV